MVKCNVCGGTCTEAGDGKYVCDYCGAVVYPAEPVSARGGSARTIGSSEKDGADVYDGNIAAVLEINCRSGNNVWQGSGYIVTDDGYAVTNAHVAAESGGRPAGSIAVKVCGETIGARVVALADDKAGKGNGTDLAVIRLDRMPKGAKKIEFADSDKIRNGETVFVIGNSLGMGMCITRGIVSDKLRRVNGKDFIMTDCAVNGGNSGGPIFNGSGCVIGTMTLQGRAHDGGDAEGMNYAIPSNVVVKFLRAAISRR